MTATANFHQLKLNDQTVYEVNLTHGLLKARLTSIGASLVEFHTPDQNKNVENIILSCPDIEGYLTNPCYLGTIVGRYANRIAGGKFSLNGNDYTLAVNNGPNALHGGIKGWSYQNWELVQVFETAEKAGVTFKYESADGEEGYPGKVTVQVTYELTAAGLTINYEATTEADTVINLTNHAYFNLGPNTEKTIESHLLQIHADTFTPVDETAIPSGELKPVEGTPFDFRSSKPIGQNIADTDQQLTFGKGYDHNFVLGQSGEMKLAAIAREPKSRRELRVSTTEPGVQLYTGNWLAETPSANGPLIDRAGFCLETQHFPDSPNQPQFPSTVLKAGETFKSITRFEVGTY